MPTPEDIRHQMEKLTADLVGLSLCDRQNFPALRDLGQGCREVGIGDRGNISFALKNVPYHEIYSELERTQTYNLRMLDGALIQMMYRFRDRVTIEKTFEALLQIINEMDDEESLAVFDLLRKPNLTSNDIKRIKAVAVDLLETLKAEKLRINHWRDKESTRDAVRLTIQDYLWSEQTGLPETYSEEDVRDKTEAVFVHVFRAYPTVPSPYYASMAS